MGKTVDIESRRVADLAAFLDARISPDAEYYAAPIEQIEDAARWRRAARIVGRRRGWNTRTGITDSSVWVADERSLGEVTSQSDAVVTRRLESLIQDALRSQD
jgi:hypothetical protein